jgi:hypothetical protein
MFCGLFGVVQWERQGNGRYGQFTCTSRHPLSLQRALYSAKLVQDSAANPWPISLVCGHAADVRSIHAKLIGSTAESISAIIRPYENTPAIPLQHPAQIDSQIFPPFLLSSTSVRWLALLTPYLTQFVPGP